VLDRTVSHVPLSEGGFTEEPGGYGLLEQWIARLGHYTVRADVAETFSGDVLVVLSPTESVTDDYQRRLVEWVSKGGKLVVLDSPDSSGTTANSLLWPFGISVYHASVAQGNVRVENGDWPGISVGATCQVEGGEPFMWVGETAVAATARYGDGTVTAIGFGALMNNAGMGGTWISEPGPAQRLVYNLVFELLDSIVEDRPIHLPQPATDSTNPSQSQPGSGAIETIQEEVESP
jgi:hypothetical protein